MPYVILAILTIAGMWLWDGRQDRPGRRSAEMCYWILCVLYAAVAGLRYRIGVDTVQYEMELSVVPPVSEFNPATFAMRYEPGIIILTGITRMFTPWIWPVQLICALWVNTAVFIFGKRMTERWFLFAGLYLLCAWLNMNFEVMREGVAIGFFLLAWPYFKRGEWWRYYLMIVGGILFHYSAVVLLLLPLFRMPYLRKIYESPRVSSSLMVVALLLGVFIPWGGIFEWLSGLTFLPDSIAEIFKKYHTDYFVLRHGLNLWGITGYLVKFVLYPLSAVLLLRRRSLPVFAGLLLLLLGIQIEPVRRLSNYFLPFLLAVTVNMVEAKRSKMSLGCWILAFVPLIFFTLRGYDGRRVLSTGKEVGSYVVYCPYSSWIERGLDIDREQYILEVGGYYDHYDVKKTGYVHEYHEQKERTGTADNSQ